MLHIEDGLNIQCANHSKSLDLKTRIEHDILESLNEVLSPEFIVKLRHVNDSTLLEESARGKLRVINDWLSRS